MRPTILAVFLAIAALGALLLCASQPAASITTLMLIPLIGMAVTANQVIQRQKPGVRSAPVAGSTTLYEGTLAFINSSGYLDDDTANGANSFFGIVYAKKDNSSGSNGDLTAECYTDGSFLLTGSGFAQTDVGKLAYATDNYTITASPTANNVPIGRITQYVSATKVWVAIGREMGGVIRSLTESVTYGNFTDNGDTTGYIDLTQTLDKDLLVFGWKAVVATGFTGDTSATLQVGVATDLDAYSADTANSVFAAGTVGSASLAAAAFHEAAVKVRLTVTSATDFTSVSAGAMTVTIYYLDCREL